jgi:hypothetical protein
MSGAPMHTRYSFFLAAFGLILTSSVTKAADDATEVIRQAIEALGGREAILSASDLRTVGTAKAVTNIDKKAVEFTCLVETWQSQEHHTMYVFATFPGKVTVSDVEVVRKGKAWWTSEGRITPLTPEQTQVKLFEHYLRRVRTLLPLHDGSAFEVKTLPSLKFEDRELRGVAVSVKEKPAPKEKPTLKLYFDSESHLLTKIESELFGNRIEKVFGNYREVVKKGMKYPHSVKNYVNQDLRSEEIITEVEIIK